MTVILTPVCRQAG